MSFILQFIVVFSALLAGSSLCHAQLSSVQWWDNPDIVKALTLSPEQQQEIHSLVHQSQEERAILTPKINELRKTVSQLLGASVLDEQKIFATLTALGELHFRQRKDVVRMRLRVRQTLSQEQFNKLLAVRPNVMRQRWVPRRINLEGKSRPANKKNDSTQMKISP